MDNGLEPENGTYTLMSSALDLCPFDPKSIWNIFLPWVVYMCDMVTQSGKCNVLKPGNHCVYRQTVGRTTRFQFIPTHIQLRCGRYHQSQEQADMDPMIIIIDIKREIRCVGGVGILCRAVTLAMGP